MVYNPEFFEKMTDEHRTGVLKHEFYHLIFEHVTGRLPEAGMSRKWNFATDLAINSHLIGELPEGALIPGEGHFADLPAGKSAEWYFARLMEDQEAQDAIEGKGMEGDDLPGGMPGEMDDHDMWGEMSEEEAEIAKNKVKKAIELSLIHI